MQLTLYHGTDGQNAVSILSGGLRASTVGRLGPGVYLTDDLDIAKAVAAHKGCQFVVTVKADVGKAKDYGPGPTDAGWNANFDSATATHPPWPGVSQTVFTEFCIADVARVTVVHVEGFVAPTPQAGIAFNQPKFIVNVAHSKFLDTHGTSVWLWGDGKDVGRYPDNLRWELRPTGQADTYYIVNKTHRKFLDTHGQSGGKGVWVWQGAHFLDLGQHPENLQWQLKPVAGMPDTYYIISVAFSKFLDSHGTDVWVWGDGKDVGQHPAALQWKICDMNGL